MVKEILTFQTLWKWYEQPIVKNTISEYCRNRLVQLGSDPVLRRYIDKVQTKPYWSPTPDEVVEWIGESGLVGFLASITTLTAPCTKQRIQEMRPYVNTVDLIIDIDCRPGVILENVKNLAKYLQVPYKELGLLDATFATNSRRSSNNLHIITPGKAIPKIEGWDQDVLVGALADWIVSRVREIVRQENPKLHELITLTAQKDASITIVPYHNLDRPFPVPLSLYWKPEKEIGTFICPFPLTEIERYDSSWASVETPNFQHKDCWKVEGKPSVNIGKLIEILTQAKELKKQRRELDAGTWQPPQDIDLDKVRQAIKEEERFGEVLCPGMVRAFTFPFGMGHRRPCLSVCHAYLRGIGLDDDIEIKGILEKRNEKFDPPLEAPTLDKFFESESERFGEYYGPPGCKVMVHGGGAYFDGIQTLQLCEGRCDLSDLVTHPVWYTVRKIGGRKYERVKLCEITSFHCRKPLEAHVLISGVSASYRVPIWAEVKASQCAHDGNCPLLKGISSWFYVDDQVKFIERGEGSQRTESAKMLVGRRCPEKLQCFEKNCEFTLNLKTGTLTECFAMDAVDELRLDEKSITPRIVKIYVAREPPQPGSVAICQGTVGTLPRTSQLVFVADNFSEAKKELDAFDLEKAKPFLLKTTMEEQVRLLQTATGAVGREDLLQAILLTYCSPLYIQWKNITTPGWLITEIYGDTRTFKSEGAKRVRRLLSVGLYVSMETGSRTGILYTISQTKTGYIILWGELIYADRGVLIIDGANRLKGEEWIEFREARSDGLVKVRRAAKGEAWCRVRQIFIRNPESGEALKNFAFRLQAIRYQPPDIARYDLFIPVWEEHVKEIIERPPTGRRQVR